MTGRLTVRLYDSNNPAAPEMPEKSFSGHTANLFRKAPVCPMTVTHTATG